MRAFLRWTTRLLSVVTASLNLLFISAAMEGHVPASLVSLCLLSGFALSFVATIYSWGVEPNESR
ncbi:hypothetical protein J057_01835 [Marinobacter nanhaiticus D15-8W]|uniref:Uncharacterized protein n=1 Tax=Marinobacter nanhaiticus D15-8W TaxID=626887 RepID=N6W2Y6_9GAMM|nr:hypothetical protein J057_01835 [Marinobacter nanhaiticus D15-8W]